MWPAVLGLVGICFFTGADSAIVTDIYVDNNQAATKGNSIQLVCEVTGFSTGSVDIYKTYRSTRPSADIAYLGTCSKDLCIPAVNGRYSLLPDANRLTIDIKNLSRGEDQRWWHCAGAQNSHQVLQIIVYSPPSALHYTNVPAQSQDLSTGSATLTCQTNCVYPKPELKWFYLHGTSRALYTSTRSSDSSVDCIDQEQKFSFTLTLEQYTTFPANEDKTVKFQCEIKSFQGLLTPLYSPESPDITFSVRVTAVTLKDGDKIPGATIMVTDESDKQLSCITSLSRPPATIVWYIGIEQRQRSTEETFTFSPVNKDHDKNIYCKAFNIQLETNAVSSTVHKLHVNVAVKSVTLKDGINQAGSTVIATEDVSRTLTCDPGISRPTPSLTWYIGSSVKQKSTGTKYTFTPTNEDHKETIYCTAENSENPAAVVSRKTTLYIRVETGIPQIKNTSESLLSGNELKFVCQSTATRPAAIVTWTKGGVAITNVTNSENNEPRELTSVTSTVTFTTVPADNGKDIVCTTHIPKQTKTTIDRVQMTVWWPPSEPIIQPMSFPWLEGQTHQFLQCVSTNNGNPTSTIEWTSQSGSKEENGNLVFPKLTFSHNNERVTCNRVNGYTQRKNIDVMSQEIQLDVQYKPIVAISCDDKDHQSITVNEGQALHCVCSATGNPRLRTVEWLGQTDQITDTLSFTDIDRSDDKMYTCKAKSTSQAYPTYDFTTEKTLYIGVNYAPDVIITPSADTYIESETLQISCTATGKPSDYTYRGYVHSWKGQQVQDLKEIHRRVWDIHSLKLEDSGSYTCLADNGIEDRRGQLIQQKSLEIIIQAKPKVLSKGNKFVGKPGESFNVTIPFYSHPSYISVKIIQEENELHNNDRVTVATSPAEVADTFYGKPVILEGTNAMFLITNLTETDFANYSFEVQNNLDTVSWTFSISSGSPPLTQSAFIFTGKSGKIFFYWERGFNGGYKQFFIIETAVVDTNIWEQRLNISEDDKNHGFGNGSYAAEITTELLPGTYTARIYAENRIGQSAYVGLESPFTVLEKGTETTSHPLPIAAIGGGIGATVAVAVVVIAIVFIKRIQSKHTVHAVLAVISVGNLIISTSDDVVAYTSNRSRKGESPVTLDEHKGEDHHYYNVASNYETVDSRIDCFRQTYEDVDRLSENLKMYEELHQARDIRNERNVYEKLESDRRKGDGLYEELESSRDNSMQEDSKVYVNMQI